jgi:hypothetical protein
MNRVAVTVAVKPALRTRIYRLSQTFRKGRGVDFEYKNWRGRDGNDPSVDIAKDADQRF